MRRTLSALAATALLAPGCATPPKAGSAPAQSCVIVGGPKAPAEVRIYESDPYASPAGKRIYVGILNHGERHLIESPTGRIWYAFRWSEGDSWREGYQAPCSGGQTVNLPP
jgi:hypothetical protein